MEDFLTGKYVRLGSGAYVGKLGRAVTRTVGNIYSISVLNIPGEKQGRHTSVTSSKLELINEFDLNDLEKSYIKMEIPLGYGLPWLAYRMLRNIAPFSWTTF